MKRVVYCFVSLPLFLMVSCMKTFPEYMHYEEPDFTFSKYDYEHILKGADSVSVAYGIHHRENLFGSVTECNIIFKAYYDEVDPFDIKTICDTIVVETERHVLNKEMFDYVHLKLYTDDGRRQERKLMIL